MTVFHFRAVDPKGQIVEDSIEARTVEACNTALEHRGLTLLSVEHDTTDKHVVKNQARMRTQDLRRAGAWLRTYFVDGDGQRIERSVRARGPVRSGGKWEQVSIRLNGDALDAAWIGLQVELRQAGRRPDSPLGNHQLLLTDVKAKAWIDDIAIWQLPRVIVRSQSPVNIVRAPTRPELVLQVRDVAGHELEARATVYDHRWNPVASMGQRVGGGASDAVALEPPAPGPRVVLH